jgi:hypothetical protein
MRKIILLTVLLSVFLTFGTAYPIDISPTGDADTLVNSILGPGVTLVPGTATYGGSAVASGTFTNGAVVGIASGIILTSGTASDAVGPNNNGDVAETIGGGGPGDDTTTSLGLDGDADLDILAGYPTYDASVLEFDFQTAAQGDIIFKFVFASEEYIDYVGTQFNDVFGFFLDGVNIGLVPGTSDPVTINTINPNVNAAYFLQNISVSPPPSAPYDIEYDGFTTVLTAEYKDLPAGTHHMKLAIADGSDSILDAAVFIQEGSFTFAQIQVPVDIKPGSCPNPIQPKTKGVLPVAIAGTDTLDVTKIDPASILLNGVSPLRWDYYDAAKPHEPYIGKNGAYDCSAYYPDEYGVVDGYMDLRLYFDMQAIVASLGSINGGDVLLLQLTGKLKEEFGGTEIVGEDVVIIRMK